MEVAMEWGSREQGMSLSSERPVFHISFLQRILSSEAVAGS